MKWNAPVDPECPDVQDFTRSLYEDPMTLAYHAPVDEIVEDFERKHRRDCPRCQEYGAANIEVKE